jgi:hypothetical protein
VQIDLNAIVVGQHPEADRIRPAKEFLVRVESDVEVVVQQIVVGAIASVVAKENLGPGERCPLARSLRGGRRCRRRRVGRRGARADYGRERERRTDRS